MKILLAVSILLVTVSAVAGQSFNNGWSAYIQRDFQKSVAIWKPLAKSGDHRAMAMLSHMYDEGIGVSKNPKLASEYGHKQDLQANQDIRSDYLLKYGQSPIDSQVQLRALFSWNPNKDNDKPPKTPAKPQDCKILYVTGLACANEMDVFTVEESANPDWLLEDNPLTCRHITNMYGGESKLINCRGCMVLNKNTALLQGTLEGDKMSSIIALNARGVEFNLWTRKANTICAGRSQL